MKRRDFLAATPVAALAPIAAIQANASAPRALAENPALLALGEQLPQIEAAYHDAVAAWDAMWREWRPQWPLAPEPCTERNLGWFDEAERGLDGAALVRPGQERELRVLRLSHMEWRRDNMMAAIAKDAQRKRKAARSSLKFWQAELAKMELGIALLPGYLAECQRVKRASGFDHIEAAKTNAAKRVFAFAREVLALPSHTLEGVLVKARAVAALGLLSRRERKWASVEDVALHDQHMATLLGKALVGAF